MYALYEFSNLTVEVGRLNLIEGDYEPDVDKEYVVWWSKNGKTTAWTAKILATDEDKGALIRMRNRLVEGMDGEEQEKHMGKGKRVKKKKPFLEDDMEQSEERPSKKNKPAMSSSSSEIIKKYKDLQKARDQMAKNSINEEGDVRTLEQRVAKLERENSSLRNALSIIEGLPKMISSMQQLISAQPNKQSFPRTMKDNNDVAEAPCMPHTSTAGPSLQSSRSQLPVDVCSSVAVCLDIPQGIKDRCNKVSAAKYTNDLMHGLYTTEFMASHSVTGLGSSSKGETRPSLPHEDVKKIICKYFFFSGNQ
ncbi:BEN domain-containing protein [Pimephales promelas]|nr:BEN domain-containing protein [Pimephales promelas]